MTKNFYTVRSKCIFCDHELTSSIFEKDKENYVAHYSVGIDANLEDMHNIPFNVCECNKCGVIQNKYLGDVSEIYRINHADSTGEIMTSLHELNLSLITKYKNKINNIVEIGSSKGILADAILENFDCKYFIIEPSYFGKIGNQNKIIISDFYENVNDSEIEANTLVMSHVFEHFYNPKEILKKMTDNKNITNIFLTFPDLEYYVKNKVFHVLNTEHTFYIKNDFLINLFSKYGFKLIEKRSHNNHSVLFYFERSKFVDTDSIRIDFKIDHSEVYGYFDDVVKCVEKFNDGIGDNLGPIFLWPASIHSLYLFNFGLEHTKLSGFLDNSKLKIGKKMYGTDLNVFDFNDKINSENKDSLFLINGGVFNDEIKNKINNVKYII
jgi:hypothetical protein